MTEHKNIHEAIHAIYNDVGYVKKERSNGLNYTFASETAFIEKLRPSMIEHGVTVSVESMDSLNQETYTTAKGSVMMRSTIHGAVRFQHVSGTSMLVESYGEGSDSGDKSVNKAMTDLYKYALRQTFMIETGDDPDKDASQERSNNYKTPEQKPVVKDEKPATPYHTEGGDPVSSQANSPDNDQFAGVCTEEGIPYCDLRMPDLANRFNSLSKSKAKDPGAFTAENQRKLDAVNHYMKILRSRGAAA